MEEFGRESTFFSSEQLGFGLGAREAVDLMARTDKSLRGGKANEASSTASGRMFSIIRIRDSGRVSYPRTSTRIAAENDEMLDPEIGLLLYIDTSRG
jgi:hypothetical protein